MELYPFQQYAVDYLRAVPAALVGDEMGLGKTVEGVALDLAHRADRNATALDKTLVVAPTSLMDSWAEHFQMLAPHLKVCVIDPKVRLKMAYQIKHSKAQVFIMHWAAVRLMPELQETKWFHIIGDEIQAIKNRDAQQSIAFKKLKATFKTGLSGTAADNKPQDLWSILNWLYPNTWSAYWRFFKRHCSSTNHTAGPMMCEAEDCFKVHKRAFRETGAPKNLDELHDAMRPFYVRRLKTEVLKELPDKYYTNRYVHLGPKQRRAYDNMREAMLAWVGEHEHEAVAAPAVISQLIRLQQFAVAFGELVEVKRKIPNSNPPEYQLVDTLRLTEPSTKLDAVMEILGETDGQIVVFAQSKQVINLLMARLARVGISACSLTGDTPQKDRGKLVAEFQQGKYRVFAGTVEAGGVGVTLTAASTMVFIDLPWSPSKLRQAEDRCHRIGQKNAVQIIRLIGVDTLDAERNEKIELKWEWIRAILGDK